MIRCEKKATGYELEAEGEYTMSECAYAVAALNVKGITKLIASGQLDLDMSREKDRQQIASTAAALIAEKIYHNLLVLMTSGEAGLQ